ncbi:MAG: class I SAM-dependent methyltransferase [Fibrobacterota bacterium]
MMYDRLAEDYDRMTRFEERLKTEGALLAPWVKGETRWNILDAACGTGLHSIVLAGMGKKVTGADRSKGMLARARCHAKKQGAHVRFVCADFGNLREKATGPFDTVICLGNSLPHLLTDAALSKTLRDFHHVLKPGGLLLLQLINYDRVLKEKTRLVGMRHDRELTFIRMYDFLEKNVRFNVLTLREKSGRTMPEIRSTELHPWRQRELLTALKTAGFVQPEIFGGLDRKLFSASESTDLVIACRKPA